MTPARREYLIRRTWFVCDVLIGIAIGGLLPCGMH